MKRLLLISLIGFTYASQAETNQLTILAAQSALPPLAGLAAATAWTLGRAGLAHSAYNAGTLMYLDNYKNKPFINTLAFGSTGEVDARYGSINNIGYNWLVGIVGGTIAGIVYGIYKNGIKDNLKLTIGTGIAGCGLGILSKMVTSYISGPNCNPDLRTNFFAKG